MYRTPQDHYHAVMATGTLVATLIAASVGLPDRGRSLSRKRFVRQEIDWGVVVQWEAQMAKKRRETDKRHSDMCKS